MALSKANGSIIPDGNYRYYTLLQNVVWYLFYHGFNGSEFGLRLPSALYGLATVILIYWVTRKLTGSFLAGACAGGIGICLQSWVHASRECKPGAGELLAFGIVAFVFVTNMSEKITWRRVVVGSGLLTIAVSLGNSAAIASAPSVLLAIFMKVGPNRNDFEKRQLYLLSILFLVVLAATASWFLWLKDVGRSGQEAMSYAYVAKGLLPVKEEGFVGRIVWVVKNLFFLGAHLYHQKGFGLFMARYEWANTGEMPGVSELVRMIDDGNWLSSEKIMWVLASLATVWGFIRWPAKANFYRVWVFMILALFAGLGFAGQYPLGVSPQSRWAQVMFLPFGGFGMSLLISRKGVAGILAGFAFGIAVVGMLFAHVNKTVVSPEVREHTRPVIRYLEANAKENDVVFVYRGAIYAFEHYWRGNREVKIEKMVFEMGDRGRWRALLSELRKNDSTVWILFSHESVPGFSDSMFVETVLAELGVSYERYDEVGARLIWFRCDSVERSRNPEWLKGPNDFDGISAQELERKS